MKIEKIITLANRKVRLLFNAMERSLRATGCDLPLFVIPYDEEIFDLPKNSHWLRNDALFDLIAEAKAVPMCRKYLALMQEPCAYFDVDIIHLRDLRSDIKELPNDVFVVADTEWSKARWTYTPETRVIYQKQTTLWLLNNFNAGFFSYATAPISLADVCDLLKHPALGEITRGKSATGSDQEGTNFLIHQSAREVLNLCLPPHRMESTMACDYPENFRELLALPAAAPFIHFAGDILNSKASITQLFSSYLTPNERQEWEEQKKRRFEEGRQYGHWPLWVRAANRVIPYLDKRFKLQWLDPSRVK